MRWPTKIFLVGPMGAGKSTIGKKLANLMGLGYLDSDREIQNRTGVDIPTIFEYEGEAGFRKRELSVIAELTETDNIVLATGGGAIVEAENRKNLAARGFVVYLFCTPEQQHERTAQDKNRPLLQTDDPLATLKALMTERDPLYRDVADIVVSTEDKTAVNTAKSIIKHFDE